MVKYKKILKNKAVLETATKTSVTNNMVSLIYDKRAEQSLNKIDRPCGIVSTEISVQIVSFL